MTNNTSARGQPRSTRAGGVVAFVASIVRSRSASGLVLSDVRDEREVTRALHRTAELTLEAGVDHGRPLRQELPALGQEPRERGHVLEVEQLDGRTLDP